MGKIIDKLLLFIYSLFILTVSIIGICVVLAWVPKEQAGRFMVEIYTNSYVSYWVLAVCAVVLLISLRFLFISLRRGQADAPSISERTEFGEFRISVETIENLSLKAASKVRGVKDLRVRVNVTPPGLEITVRTYVDGERTIPEITQELQQAIKGHIEEITGYPVVSVSVYVANTVQSSSNNAPRRVE
ncbi:alkaline shock response membrane anchor protein AmaP [Paenibacillus sp. N1-5-1-14]|uniref:alkaline shock response membrane anchor protein AmaP n=1 Tax=Paenibacillus radicibacter TaxID=2972488 RepID=UPI0021599361|nr:alkaline shock response membrane anchor protein AmaP [Paenibacillus radicibacter]MCR8642413.1 alkaline shock response membrane anchor protein AmaP [Paenibacillus radicibacter]